MSYWVTTNWGGGDDSLTAGVSKVGIFLRGEMSSVDSAVKCLPVMFVSFNCCSSVSCFSFCPFRIGRSISSFLLVVRVSLSSPQSS